MAKFSANGSTALYGASGGAPASLLGQVISGEVDFGELGMTEVSTLDTARKEYVPGLHESMSFNVVVQWDPALAGHAAAMTAYLAKTKVAGGFRYSDTGAAEVYCDGYWTNVSAPVEVDGKLQATFSFKGTGTLTFAA